MYLSTLASVTAFNIETKNFGALSSDSYSVGHICWINEYEYYYTSGQVMYAHKTDVVDINTGNRIGRSVTTSKSVAQYPEVYAYLGKTFIGLCEWGNEEYLGV